MHNMNQAKADEFAQRMPSVRQRGLVKPRHKVGVSQ
jgi:hypothetical protein